MKIVITYFDMKIAITYFDMKIAIIYFDMKIAIIYFDMKISITYFDIKIFIHLHSSRRKKYRYSRKSSIILKKNSQKKVGGVM